MNTSIRKTASAILAFVMCLSVFMAFPSETKAYGETFFIDIGHGGNDPGAVGPGGREEADDVLRLSLRVGELLTPYTTFKFSRTSDVTLSLSERSSMANAGGHDYLISIHRNSFSNPDAKGLEVWWSEWTASYDTNTCIKFAQSVYDGVMEQVPVFTQRGLKSGVRLHMTSSPTMPSCLIETGFISNDEDNQIFDDYFEEIAVGIANGMLAMIGKKLDGATSDHKLDGQDYVDMGKDFYARIANDNIGKYFTDENNEVWARDFTGAANQVWHFMRQANGAYLVGNSATSKFLSVKDGVYKDGTRLVTSSVTYDDYQKFYIFYMYNNFYMMPAGRDMTIDIDCSLFHTQVCGKETGYGKDEASFKARSLNLEIISIGDGTRDIANLGDSFQATIQNSASGKYVTANGSSLVAADKNNADTQKWNFTRLPNGSYTIVSQSENLAIDVTNTLLAEGTAVDMYNLTKLNAQTFFLIEKDGSYYIKPTYTLNTLHMNASTLDFAIYATGDDSTKLAAQKFEISILGSSESSLVIKDNSAYEKDEANLNNVAAGQTVSGLLSNFANENAVVYNEKGEAVTGNAKVGTGYTVSLVVDGKKVDTLTVIILGDVTGDGIVDGTDYLKIKSSILGGDTLTGAYGTAADVDGNNEVESTDYLRVKAHFLGTYNLFA